MPEYRSKYLFILLFSLILAACSSSKNTQTVPKVTKDNVNVVTETSPAIVGGLDALHQQLRYHSNLYRAGTSITIETTVLVDTEGTVKKISFKPQKYSDLNNAAREAIRQVRFVPGKRNGQAVEMFVTLPIQFTF